MRAYAKVNLTLSVGPPFAPGSPDAGMHPIASWMHTVDLFDDLDVEPRADSDLDHYDIRWTPSAPNPSIVDWPLEHDLTVRAHRLLQEHVGRRLPVSLSLTKRIPVGAGLGGGSSDAAAALALINRAFSLGLPREELVHLSRRLGSDVAFFLDDDGPARPAIVTGAGDHVERIEPVSAYLILIIPHFPCPTSRVYAEYDRRGPRTLREQDVRDLARAGWLEARTLFNDLEEAAEAAEPRLADLRTRAHAASQRPVHMTGSGSGLFIACAEELEARRVATTITPALRDATVVRTRLL